MMLALASMLCLGFSSCSSDDDDDDNSSSSTTETLDTKVNNAVGTYKGTAVTYLLTSDGKLYDIDKVLSSNGISSEVKFNDGDVSTVHVTREGTSNLLITDSDDSSDILRCTKLANANNGFTFDISSQVKKNLTIEGYEGYDLVGVKYNGGYLTATKTLGYYQKMSISDFESSIDESLLAEISSIVESYTAVVEDYTMVKQ